jgi:hypothetical protein
MIRKKIAEKRYTTIKPKCEISMNKVKPGEKTTSGRFLKTLKIPVTTIPPPKKGNS